MVLFASLSALMINAMLCNIAIGKGRGLMQGWANFLSVVGQLVGPGGPNSPPVYVLKYALLDMYMHVCVYVTPAGKKVPTQWLTLSLRYKSRKILSKFIEVKCE